VGVTTPDVGGALEFRALDAPKGKAYGTRVGELDVLSSDRYNPHAVRLFAGMAMNSHTGHPRGDADPGR
jgi:hypothetical protein